MLAQSILAHGGELAESCVERAAGNPLFLEQLAPAGPGDGLDRVGARDGAEPGAGAPGSARRADKAALQAAAVFGQRFDRARARSCARPLRLPARPARRAPSAAARRWCELPLRPRVGAGRRLQFVAEAATARAAPQGRGVVRRTATPCCAPSTWTGRRRRKRRPPIFERRRRSSATTVSSAPGRCWSAAWRWRATPPDLFALTCLHGETLHDLGAIADALHVLYDGAGAGAGRCRALPGLAGARGVQADDRGLRRRAGGPGSRRERPRARLDLADVRARAHFLAGNLCFPRGDIDGMPASPRPEPGLCPGLRLGAARGRGLGRSRRRRLCPRPHDLGPGRTTSAAWPCAASTDSGASRPRIGRCSGSPVLRQRRARRARRRTRGGRGGTSHRPAARRDGRAHDRRRDVRQSHDVGRGRWRSSTRWSG